MAAGMRQADDAWLCLAAVPACTGHQLAQQRAPLHFLGGNPQHGRQPVVARNDLTLLGQDRHAVVDAGHHVFEKRRALRHLAVRAVQTQGIGTEGAEGAEQFADLVTLTFAPRQARLPVPRGQTHHRPGNRPQVDCDIARNIKRRRKRKGGAGKDDGKQHRLGKGDRGGGARPFGRDHGLRGCGDLGGMGGDRCRAQTDADKRRFRPDLAGQFHPPQGEEPVLSFGHAPATPPTASHPTYLI